jgi:hypothetical protein
VATIQMNEEARKVRPSWRSLGTAIGILFALCLLLRIGLLNRHGLWADEFFSLAMATGHSLEHPAAQANAGLGDYIETSEPVSPSAYSRYLEHSCPPASTSRVVRAVLLSDTSPPLYYLLLYTWTRALGTGDVALRLFSLAWALACLPVLASLARRTGGRVAWAPVSLLFTFSPLCVFFSTEGRMYSLLWFWTVCAMWLTLELGRRGVRPGLLLLWVACGAAGLLTHYFFVFVWAAALAWLWLYPRRCGRWAMAAGAVLTGLLVLPWYAHLPDSLAAWRVTGRWLHERPGNYHPVLAFLYLPWSYFSIQGPWGVSLRLDCLHLALFLTLIGAVCVAVRGRFRRTFFRPRRWLLWLWLLSTPLGLAAFDLLRGTYVLAVPRYALAGMPAAFLLAGLGLSRLRLLPCTAFLMLIALVSLAGIHAMYRHESRCGEPTRQIGHVLAESSLGPTDLVIVHSIPSGVVGIARYLEEGGASAKGVGFASWVGQLAQRRVPEDVHHLTAGYRRVILVKVHEVGEPAPQEAWLRQTATLTEEWQLEAATILFFRPRGADTFAPPGSIAASTLHSFTRR